MTKYFHLLSVLFLVFHISVLQSEDIFAAEVQESSDGNSKYLQISGVYPHLATHNQPPGSVYDSSKNNMRRAHGEAGIGAVVPWAGRLWYITYPQHQLRGSFDKLYEVDEQMNLTIRPESVGGTHASRMIHKESNQLIIGPYFIDENRNVRACDLQKLVGRMTAAMRHLQMPDSKVYFFDMEGMIYEVDVHSLAVKKLFNKPFPGWHGKGAYTAQNRVVFANNGESVGSSAGYGELLVGTVAKNRDEAGALVEWDGKETFKLIERKQFTDVTGPGGIYGSPNDQSPLWAMGWDKRSVLLKLLDNGNWSTFRVPKGSHAFDHRHGWYTEWPRIREYAPNRLMMIQHASMFEFPKTFSAKNTAGIRPIATHLRYIPDIAFWQGKIILAADEAAMMENPMCGQAQSNLWFGTLEEIKRFGPGAGWGGVWLNDEVQADTPSDPYLFADYEHRTLHLKIIEPQENVRFTIELNENGVDWKKWHEISLTPEKPYTFWIVPKSLRGEWIRIRSDRNCRVTAYFHYLTPRKTDAQESKIFDPMASVDELQTQSVDAVMRPAARNRSLQILFGKPNEKEGNAQYRELEIDPDNPMKLQFTDRQTNAAEDHEIQFVSTVCKIDNSFIKILPHAVKVRDHKNREYLLPKGSAEFDRPTGENELRTLREVQSERWFANIHGTFYELPRADDNRSPDFAKMKPIASHNKRIVDFCSWRGLLVLSGVKNATKNSNTDRCFFDDQGRGLWFGQIDDFWKAGTPKGTAAVWFEEKIEAEKPSLPILATNYDRKMVRISHDQRESVRFRLECDFDHTGFVNAFQFDVPGEKEFEQELPEGFLAHWIRVVAEKDCTATVRFEYR